MCLWVSEIWLQRDMLKPERKMLAKKAESRVWAGAVSSVTVSHEKTTSTAGNPREKPCQKTTQDLTVTVIVC